MPILFTNESRKPNLPMLSTKSNFCVSSYEEYLLQRVPVKDVKAENIEQLTSDFKTRVAIPVQQKSPDIEMGEYFVIPVSELQQMLSSGDNPEFIKVCNALRRTRNSKNEEKLFPVTVLVPMARMTVPTTDGGTAQSHEVCNNEHSVFIEAYPCPPDPRCPKDPTDPTKPFKEVSVFPTTMTFNNFESLK